MKNKTKRNFEEPPNRQEDNATSDSLGSFVVLKQVAGALAVSLLCSLVAVAQGDSPTQLRRFIDQQVGGIDKLKVPAKDADIPLPRQPDGTVNPRYQTTEEKSYLGSCSSTTRFGRQESTRRSAAYWRRNRPAPAAAVTSAKRPGKPAQC